MLRLVTAVERGQVDVVRLLLRYGARVDLKALKNFECTVGELVHTRAKLQGFTNISSLLAEYNPLYQTFTIIPASLRHYEQLLPWREPYGSRNRKHL